jgi:hypothetical protein
MSKAKENKMLMRMKQKADERSKQGDEVKQFNKQIVEVVASAIIWSKYLNIFRKK